MNFKIVFAGYAESPFISYGGFWKVRKKILDYLNQYIQNNDKLFEEFRNLTLEVLVKSSSESAENIVSDIFNNVDNVETFYIIPPFEEIKSEDMSPMIYVNYIFEGLSLRLTKYNFNPEVLLDMQNTIKEEIRKEGIEYEITVGEEVLRDITNKMNKKSSE